MTILYIVLGIIVLLILYVIVAYNGFISRVNRTKEAWADIDVQLKRRYDLIPNLVETVKGYAAHETAAFENVTKARAAALGAQSVEEHAQAENQLTGALKTIFSVAEAYPDLKANRTSSSSSASSATRKTRSRPPAASTTATSATSTRPSSPSRATSSRTASASKKCRFSSLRRASRQRASRSSLVRIASAAYGSS